MTDQVTMETCTNCYVFGIVAKRFENVREWWLFHVDILHTFWVFLG